MELEIVGVYGDGILELDDDLDAFALVARGEVEQRDVRRGEAGREHAPGGGFQKLTRTHCTNCERFRCVLPYHTRQTFSGIMGWPTLQPKASPNSGMFWTTPFTRNCRGECGSVCTCRRNCSGRVSAAPGLSVAQEELLNRCVAVLLLLEVDVLSFGIRQECHVGKTYTAVVCRVLSQGQLAIHLDVVHRNKVAVLLHFAVGFGVELLCVFGCPPIGEIAVARRTGALRRRNRGSIRGPQRRRCGHSSPRR